LAIKVVRDTPLARQINPGNVLMLKGAWNEPLKEECWLFPKATAPWLHSNLALGLAGTSTL
jgi:hypothetical protein